MPFLSFLICLILGRFIGKYFINLSLGIIMLINVFMSLICFYEVGLCNSVCDITLFSWVFTGSLNLKWNFFFDAITVTMLCIVNIVSFFVHIYSMSYMSSDPYLTRFLAFLSLFTFFMLILVTSGNFIQMFVGWEGVGLASYLLISFWNTRLEANKSAIKAVLINRIGDLGLMLSFIFIFYIFNTFDFCTIFCLVKEFKDIYITVLNFDINALLLINVLIFLGAVGKSAQLGLHIWLPDAMEGPTPVSALIHAATMVTAGVFIIIRCSPMFEYTPELLSFIAILGGLTSFFAAICGFVQYDLKKVIAYSTCSQLGYMIFICGLSGYSLGLFHLMNHAFFKALLFLSAGSVIHAVNDEQDMRKMGGLINILPFTYLMIFIGSLSLMGFPFLTGFYSKDIILELAFVNYTFSGKFVYWLGLMAAFFTAGYSARLLYLTFITKVNGTHKVYENSAESDFFIIFPLLSLFFGTVFVGFIFKDMFIGPGTDFWSNAILNLPVNVTLFDGEFLPWYIKFMPFIFSIGGVLFSLFILLCIRGKHWLQIFKFDSNRYFIYIIFFRAYFNFLIMYDYFICSVLMPFILSKYIFFFCIKVLESSFMVFIMNFRIFILNFIKYFKKLHTGILVFYFSWFYTGIFLLIFLTILNIYIYIFYKLFILEIGDYLLFLEREFLTIEGGEDTSVILNDPKYDNVLFNPEFYKVSGDITYTPIFIKNPSGDIEIYFEEYNNILVDNEQLKHWILNEIRNRSFNLPMNFEGVDDFNSDVKRMFKMPHHADYFILNSVEDVDFSLFNSTEGSRVRDYFYLRSVIPELSNTAISYGKLFRHLRLLELADYYYSSGLSEVDTSSELTSKSFCELGGCSRDNSEDLTNSDEYSEDIVEFLKEFGDGSKGNSGDGDLTNLDESSKDRYKLLSELIDASKGNSEDFNNLLDLFVKDLFKGCKDDEIYTGSFVRYGKKF